MQTSAHLKGSMADIYTKTKRSEVMRAVRSRNTKPELFIPDADETSLEALRVQFKESTDQPIPLSLNLRTVDGAFPILYQAQEADEFVGQTVEGTKNEVAPPATEMQGKYVILSVDQMKIPLRYPLEALEHQEIFNRYFDYHNLLLKAAYYFHASLVISAG